jgi:hypothetical protein
MLDLASQDDESEQENESEQDDKRNHNNESNQDDTRSLVGALGRLLTLGLEDPENPASDWLDPEIAGNRPEENSREDVQLTRKLPMLHISSIGEAVELRPLSWILKGAKCLRVSTKYLACNKRTK